MKDIRPALRSFLLEDPTISGLVGGSRIHSARLPQDQLDPSIVYHKISEIGDYDMDGDTSLGQMRMQIDAWALSNDIANQLANAVYDKLTGHRGIITFNSSTLDMKGAFLASGREDYDDIMKMFRVSRDFLIWYDLELS